MSKMSTELTRHALNGATMGTRWSALFFAEPDFDPAPIRAAWAAHLRGRNRALDLWTILTFQQWLAAQSA